MQKPWKEKISLERFHENNPLPETPGVYFFLGDDDELLYIGKATILSDRVKSYFSDDIAETRGPKIEIMLPKIRSIGWIGLDSVLEALLLEGRLIRAYQPPHNSDAKDDKSDNLIIITKEKFPRVLLMRERDVRQKKLDFVIDAEYGPYPQGGAAKTALKILRHLFPYRDRCVPSATMTEEERAKARACFQREIGLCPGVCDGGISVSEYRKTINRIKLFLSGKKILLIKKLEREMVSAAKKLEFERAGNLKRLLFELQHIQDVALLKIDRLESSAARIEAYDVAHQAGSTTVGVMTVVQHGIVKKSEYRLFRLRGEHSGNDLSALEEVLTRRFAHTEWTLPELIVVDGPVAQTNVAERILRRHKLTVSVVGVVKNKKHQPDRILGPRSLVRRFEKDILLANAEAHRFAIGFHRKRKRREFLDQGLV